MFREFTLHKEVEVVEWHLMPDHVHMCLSISPKTAVANVAWCMKGKSGITISRKFLGRAENFTGKVFWARGYVVSTVGFDEDRFRAYIRYQEKENTDYDQMKLGV